MKTKCHTGEGNLICKLFQLMFREENPGISYGFRITSDKIHLIGEAQNRTSWVTTKVYERYQSHQPEYKSKQDDENAGDKVTPPTFIGRVKPTSTSNIRIDKKSHTKNIIPTNSNKEKLERSTFHRDIFSKGLHYQHTNKKPLENDFNIDGIQNEASARSGRKSKKMIRFDVKTSKRKPLRRDSSKKTNKITSVKGTTLFINTCLIIIIFLNKYVQMSGTNVLIACCYEL